MRKIQSHSNEMSLESPREYYPQFSMDLKNQRAITKSFLRLNKINLKY